MHHRADTHLQPAVATMTSDANTPAANAARPPSCAVRCMSNAEGARPSAFSAYTPGFASRTPSSSAIAAIGQPLLGDGVRRASSDSPVGQRHAASASSPTVMRAGTHESTSSARAAHLPSQVQSRPLRSPR